MDFKETESQFVVLAETLPQPVWSARPDGYLDFCNHYWHALTGITPEQSSGEGWLGIVHPHDLPQVLDKWHYALRTGSLYEIEHRLKNAAGIHEWVLNRAAPLKDPSGTILRWVGTCTSIDAQKKAEDALLTLENRYRLALKAAHLGTWEIDLETGQTLWDEGVSSLHNIIQPGRYSIALDQALEMVHPDDRELVQNRIESVRSPDSNGHYEVEYRAILADGQSRWFRSVGMAQYAEGSSPRRAVKLSGVLSDITDRRAYEEAQLLLTRELNHRVKNLFAIANGMVSMTARTAKDPKEMANALRGRLSALSRAHELVQPASISGHGADVELTRLFEAVLEPYRSTGQSRIVIDGPSVHVGSTTTTSLALVLHELATNAAKYGCLSKVQGSLAIQWTVKDDMVDLYWTETGGPVIEGPPAFEGFGTQLAQRSIAGQLGGTLEREWPAEGLRVHMTLPLGRLVG